MEALFAQTKILSLSAENTGEDEKVFKIRV
jgi:hypothetical protein